MVKKEKPCEFTMVIAWRKQAGAKYCFRLESQMGHAIGLHDGSLCESITYAQKKKMWFMAYFFLLHDFADLGLMNPIRNPTHVFCQKICTKH